MVTLKGTKLVLYVMEGRRKLVWIVMRRSVRKLFRCINFQVLLIEGIPLMSVGSARSLWFETSSQSLGDDMAYLLLYVDDILATSSDRLRTGIISQLKTEFPMSDLGPLSYFLGIVITQKPSYLLLSQEKSGPPFRDPTLYRSLASALQYLTFTRPDISYAVQQVCLFMHDPREPHYEALKRILRYVQGTIDHGLHLYPIVSHRLITYTDANWGGCPDTRRSTSGYCCFLGDNLVSWSTKRQHTLSKSSAEAEYRGVANVVSEACWLRNLLLELHCPLRQATIVYCDNVSAIYLSGNPV
ncbi:uncharacterized protein LOC110715135 [Chenopodium quinoa]|uniref:uncharacterized protein LOC110715135 n=1 Tax=Chenopodium quinoa TaxID=63459 RepID=UPI000B78C6EF|nr:uncharacterized protein LOC110715135 [Chenopodium quinoa]